MVNVVKGIFHLSSADRKVPFAGVMSRLGRGFRLHGMNTSYRHVGLAMLFTALALGVSSCTGYSTQAYAPVAVTGVKVTPQSVQIAAIGGTTQLGAGGAP